MFDNIFNPGLTTQLLQLLQNFHYCEILGELFFLSFFKFFVTFQLSTPAGWSQEKKEKQRGKGEIHSETFYFISYFKTVRKQDFVGGAVDLCTSFKRRISR